MSRRRFAGAVRSQPAVAENYEWKVENFFPLSETFEDYYDSPDIEFCSRTFHFRLFPINGDDFVGLYLLLKTRSPPIKILCTVGIKTAAGNTEVLTSVSREFPTFMNLHQLECMNRPQLIDRRQELAPGNALTFKVSLMIDASRPDIDFVTLNHSLKDLYVAGKECDVTLEVKDKKFRAHKLILGARTPVFAAMFSHNMTEAETGIVRVEDCDPEAFEVFLRFVYWDAVDNLTGQNVTNVYYIADKYDLPALKKECVHHMISNLTIDSVCSALDLAQRHGEELLMETVIKFYRENAREILKKTNLTYDLIFRGYEHSK